MYICLYKCGERKSKEEMGIEVPSVKKLRTEHADFSGDQNLHTKGKKN